MCKDGSDIHGFDKVALAYFGLGSFYTDKVTLFTSKTVLWSRNKCYFGLICKDGSDIHGFDKVTLANFGLGNL